MSINRITESERDFIKNVGEKLGCLRQKAGFSQNDIAKKSNCKKNHISEVERGVSRLTVYQLECYCRALHITPNEIMGYELDRLSADEIDLIRKFKRLDSEQQDSILKLLKSMTK